MSEREPNQFEMGQEHIPTAEEIHAEFRDLIGKEYKVTRTREDEKGPYLIEVETEGDEPGHINEYAYMRKGKYLEGGITATEIHVTFYINGEVISGTSVSRLVEGRWEKV